MRADTDSAAVKSAGDLALGASGHGEQKHSSFH